MQPTTIDLASVRSPEDLEVARALFTEYVESLGVDLSFQDVTAELADLPGKYAPPRGAILIANDGRTPLGCVALRPREEAAGLCEIKRLYVRPRARGHMLGRRLAEAVVAHARALGYTRVVLDTLASMREAQRLYMSLGFRPVAPYYENPLPGSIYLGLDL